MRPPCSANSSRHADLLRSGGSVLERDAYGCAASGRAGNHHHLVCRRCGSVTDVACAVGSVPCAVPAETAGFVVDEAEVTYWGTCAPCASTAAS